MDVHLELVGASKRYASSSESFELRIPHLQLERGLTYVVAGKSGCGKTTLLDAVGCISSFDSVERFILSSKSEGRLSLHKASSRQLARVRRLSLGYVLQQGGLLPFLTAEQNILLPLRLSGRDRALGEEALELASQLGMYDYMGHYPSALSIGQRQRVSIIRALVHRPELVLADEPTGALDPASAQSVCQILQRCAQFYGATMLIVSHDCELFKPIADGGLGFEIERGDYCTYSTLYQLERSEM